MRYPPPSNPSPYEEIPEEDGTVIWWLIGCGAIIGLVGLCVCGLIFSVAFFNALNLAKPTPSLGRPEQPTLAPIPQVPTQSIPTPFPSPTPSPSPLPPSPTPIPTPQLSRGSVGQRVEMGGIGLTASSVRQEAPEGESFICVVVEVTIENVGHDMLSYGPLDFKIEDREGSEYTTACASNDQTLQPGQLSKGSKVQGHVSFQVPQGATGLLLIYQHLTISGEYGIIEVDLGP